MTAITDDVEYQQDLLAAVSCVPRMHGYIYDFVENENNGKENISLPVSRPAPALIDENEAYQNEIVDSTFEVPRFHGFSYDFNARNEDDDSFFTTDSLPFVLM